MNGSDVSATGVGVGADPTLISFHYSYADTSLSYGPTSAAPTAAGIYTVTATSNDPNYTGTTTATFTIVGIPSANGQAVTTPENTPLAVTLTGSDPNTPALPLTFTVTVQPSFGSLSGTLPNLTYTPNPGHLGADTFQFTDSNGTATSTAATVTITTLPVSSLDGTSVTLSSSAPVSNFGQPVTFTALITPTISNTAPITGMVYFFDGYTLLGSQTVSNRTAALTTSSLSVGTHSTITAAYVPDASGSDNYSPSGLSADLKETILPLDGTSITVSSSAPTSKFGQPVTFTALIASKTPNAAPITGTVYFFDGYTFLASQAVGNSSAKLRHFHPGCRDALRHHGGLRP